MSVPRVPQHTRLLVALFASALALRPQLVGIGPLLPKLQDDLGISHAVAGLFGTIPVLCMGLFAVPAAFLSHWMGARRCITLCLLGITGFGLARAFAPSVVGLLTLTFGVGVGMGFTGALLPVAVKEQLSRRPAFATGVYSTGIYIGSALAAALAVPVSDALWGWRAALMTFSIFTGLLLISWWLLARPGADSVRASVSIPKPPLRSLFAWVLVSVFCFMAVVFYGLNAWLPDAYIEQGWSEESAGALIAVVNAVAIPAAFVLPWFADRIGSRRIYLLGASALSVSGLLGTILLPQAGWAWATLLGVSVGTSFPLVMTLPLDVAHGPEEVGAVTGLMLGAGYCLAAASPLLLGVARDATNSFTTSLWLMVGVSIALLASSLAITPARLQQTKDRSSSAL